MRHRNSLPVKLLSNSHGLSYILHFKSHFYSTTVIMLVTTEGMHSYIGAIISYIFSANMYCKNIIRQMIGSVD